jgi:Tol biopolymer transport system component
MKNTLLIACAVAGATVMLRAQTPAAKAPPTVDQILALKRAASPAISPDGRFVAYTVRDTNWDENAYETEIWLADRRDAAAPGRQLTNAKKSGQSPWAPDGTRIAFVSDRTDKRQIYVISPAGGEAVALTSVEDGITSFAWAPDGKSIAYTATEPKPGAMKDRDKKYGEFEIVDQEYRMTHLFVVDIGTHATRTLTSGAFTVGSFAWSPDGKSIAFDPCEPGDGGSAGDVSSSRSPMRPSARVQEGPDSDPVWSPDGSRIAFKRRWRTRVLLLNGLM